MRVFHGSSGGKIWPDLVWIYWQQNLIWSNGKLFIVFIHPIQYKYWYIWLCNIITDSTGVTFEMWKILYSGTYLAPNKKLQSYNSQGRLYRRNFHLWLCRQDLWSKDVSFFNYKHSEQISSPNPRNVKLVCPMTFIITRPIFPPTCSLCYNL